MIRAALILLILFLPVAATAERVVVQSGDHAGFSRLRLDGDFGLDWAFGRVEGGYEFRAAAGDTDWDISRSFDRITRARIAGLRDLGGGRLFIGIAPGCACHADAFVLRDGKVVLDIKDGPAPLTDAPFERALGPAGPAAAPARVREARGPARPAELRAGLPLFVAAPPADPGVTDDADAPPPVGAALPAAPDLQRDRVLETETVLLEQIARAAAQGLLDADLSRMEEEVEAATTPPDAAAPPPPEAPPPLPEPVTDDSHVTVETSVDRAAPGGGVAPKTDTGEACIDPQYFDVAQWGGPAEGSADIGAYRSRILGEFDAADGAGVTALARHYIYLTFGAEAKALIAHYAAAMDRPDLLVAMAEIVDEGQARSAPDLVAQMVCDGATALWALLAQPQLRPGQPVNAAAVAMAFAGLPAHLRNHLGPGLAQTLIAAGDTATATRIRNAMQRAEGSPTPDMALTDSRLDLATGARESALERLDALVQQDSDVMPEALLARVDEALTADAGVSPSQVSLLRSLAYEHRAGADGQRFTEALIRALAANADFAAAFAALDEAASRAALPPETDTALRAATFARLARDAADDTLLHLLIPRLGETPGLASEIRRALAARLLDLGLPDPAQRILAGDDALPDEADRRLHARAALLQGRAAVAVGYLAGLDDAEATRLRGEALEQAADYAGAVRVYGEAGDGQRRDEAAWRGGIWEAFATGDPGVQARAAALMQGEAATAAGGDAPDTPLAASRALVAQSRAARDVLDALLAEVTEPSAPDPAAGYDLSTPGG
ncbi:hypothetical protein [Sinisalibacter aestuarii]|uniref:HEAT repeat domain-containing protein n=1 Tax=Sinisalibacter aestuarii TaxID=2949426 RepID=A0ABQ5LNZ8_9RHOB|nr:hypothetical protein [Sinisalibacter aestuarii]GKY86679.1 hypothetical protein STA1M1_05480 [Sinisalibacter aestuarii]